LAPKLLMSIGGPKAFLSYASEDRPLAARIAEHLQAHGIETWWDQWEIGAGDSFRQKIDAGLGGCTCFIVLLTPTSAEKAWVKIEIDAGLVRKIEHGAKFIALRHQLSTRALPPMLSGLHSPEITDFAGDLTQLVNDIHGVTRRPPLGPAPAAALPAASGHSAAAMAIAKLLVQKARTAHFGDVQILEHDLVKDAEVLTNEDVSDALHELRVFLDLNHGRVIPKGSFFAKFDSYFMPWNPAEDALRVASDLMVYERPRRACDQIAEEYGWDMRRLNPALTYLVERKLVRSIAAINTLWVTPFVERTDETRRFVKSRTV
jgi:TIR domain